MRAKTFVEPVASPIVRAKGTGSVSPANNIKVFQNRLARGAFVGISIEGGSEPI